jgi:thioredoxin-like negative regulator of GroEL
MKLLISQIEFEELIGLQEPEQGEVLPNFTVIYFTASWCSACRRLDMGAIEAATSGANWMKCDVDQNNYTAGYCGVRSIPSFIVIRDKKVVGTLSSSDNQKVIDWVKSHMNLALAK